ncbi:DUF7344 domain-containing protein [Halostella litorea]
MNHRPEAPTRGGDQETLSTVLGDLRYRRVLATLVNRSSPVPLQELTSHLTERESDGESTEIPGSDRHSIRIDLTHRILPKLEAAECIDRQSDGVIAADPLPTNSLGMSLPDLREPEHPLWEPISVLLSHPRRQELAECLVAAPGRISLGTLTTILTKRRLGPRPTSYNAKRTLRITLHHRDLPQLAAVDLVEYDQSAQRISPNPRLSNVVDTTGIDPQINQ